ncbi:hypothetical protein [Thermomonospora amylolytica]|uniref:hypothetical protein n=1 Tax=Thermomonospora amylolytica TaxID=1411117 RepID=UPI000E6C3656|nr:hypothetical protein [Thermomonospora amylolytica]
MKQHPGPSRISPRRVLALLAAGALLLLGPLSGPARAAAPVADAQTIADSLLEHEGLYVHSQADSRRYNDAVLERLRTARDSGRLPVYVIVLPVKAAPADAAGQDALLRQVAQTIGRSGTYILQAGPAMRVHSTALTPATVARLTAQARPAGRANPAQTLVNLTGLAARAKQETSAPGPHANGGKVIPPSPAAEDGNGLVITLVAGGLVVVALAGGLLLLRRRGKAKKPAAGQPAGGPQPAAPAQGTGPGQGPAQPTAQSPAQAPVQAPERPHPAPGSDGAPPAAR